ncbi:endonuclease VII domain-containing protein [Streptomyces sp. NPDC055085]
MTNFSGGTEHVCKDCRLAPPRSVRAAPHPGPRCFTHHRVERARVKALAQARRDRQVYGLADGDYDRLYTFQGGRCALCRVATGAAKRLAVDHDHRCCNSPSSCGDCVRGLLCSVCNRFLGRVRDDKAFFRRALSYLAAPPALVLKPHGPQCEGLADCPHNPDSQW